MEINIKGLNINEIDLFRVIVELFFVCKLIEFGEVWIWWSLVKYDEIVIG